MKPTPPGWPRISAAVYYDDAARAIDWLCEAFGFEVRLKVEGEGGRIEHSELTFAGDEGLVMVGMAGGGPEKPRPWAVSPRSVNGANTQGLCLHIDDADAHCAQARKAGAKILQEPYDVDYGEDYWAERCYQAEDPEGHRWWFMQRLRTGGR